MHKFYNFHFIHNLVFKLQIYWMIQNRIISKLQQDTLQYYIESKPENSTNNTIFNIIAEKCL